MNSVIDYPSKETAYLALCLQSPAENEALLDRLHVFRMDRIYFLFQRAKPTNEGVDETFPSVTSQRAVFKNVTFSHLLDTITNYCWKFDVICHYGAFNASNYLDPV